MPEIKSIQLMKTHYTNEEIKNVYLFYGPEVFLKDFYHKKIKERLQVDSINCFCFSAEDDIKEIESVCSSLSMFGEKQLIVMYNSNLIKKDYASRIVELATESNNYIIFKEEEVDKRSKSYKDILKHGIVFFCDKQDSQNIMDTVAQRIKHSNRIISKALIEYMVKNISNDISTLLNEVDKLILYVPEGNEITKSDVDEVCTLNINPNVFELSNKIVEGNYEKAYMIMKRLLEKKESPVKQIAIISKKLSQLYNAKRLILEGVTDEELITFLGISKNAIYPIKKQANSFELEYLAQKLEKCEELDAAIKSGLIKEEIALELLTMG